MTTNATLNCVEHLWRQGVTLSDIRISAPNITLRKIQSPLRKIGKNTACQTDIPQNTIEDSFTALCNELNMAPTDFDIILSEIIRYLHN